MKWGMEWHSVTSKTQRLAVPGGWLVALWHEHGAAAAFVPRPDALQRCLDAMQGAADQIRDVITADMPEEVRIALIGVADELDEAIEDEVSP